MLYAQLKNKVYQMWRDPVTNRIRCVCGGLCLGTPEIHHLIIPRNYGVHINTVWNCVPVHPACHRTAHAHKRNEFTAKMVEYLAKRNRITVFDQVVFIRKQLDLLLTVKVDLPPCLQLERR